MDIMLWGEVSYLTHFFREINQTWNKDHASDNTQTQASSFPSPRLKDVLKLLSEH